MDKLDLAVAPERVDHRIQRVSNNSVAAFHPGFREHLPQDVSNSFHKYSCELGRTGFAAEPTDLYSTAESLGESNQRLILKAWTVPLRKRWNSPLPSDPGCGSRASARDAPLRDAAARDAGAPPV